MRRITLAILVCLLSTGCAAMLKEVVMDVGPPLVDRAIDRAADRLTGPETPLGTILGGVAAMLAVTGGLGVWHRRAFHGRRKNGN